METTTTSYKYQQLLTKKLFDQWLHWCWWMRKERARRTFVHGVQSFLKIKFPNDYVIGKILCGLV